MKKFIILMLVAGSIGLTYLGNTNAFSSAVSVIDISQNSQSDVQHTDNSKGNTLVMNKIVVFNREVFRGEMITKDMLLALDYPAQVPKNLVDYEDINKVIGQYVIRDYPRLSVLEYANITNSTIPKDDRVLVGLEVMELENELGDDISVYYQHYNGSEVAFDLLGIGSIQHILPLNDKYYILIQTEVGVAEQILRYKTFGQVVIGPTSID